MAYLSFQDIGISAMAAALPKKRIDNYSYTDYFPKEDVKNLVDKIGVFERRFADTDTCSSDLCYAAAEKLIHDNNIDKSEIDLLVFISQTPDYRMPATSITLQHRLGLPHQCIAFDISLGCSGFIYALSVVYGLMQGKQIRKALLLDGETRSKVYSPKDRRSAFLFGDAGVAILIENGEKYGKSHFSLNSDGSKANLIMIKSGGYRHMSSVESLTEHVVDEYGNIRNDEQGYMNGGDVFNFVIREIPSDITNILNKSNKTIQDIDFVVLHQANNFINSYILKKMKIDASIAPQSIAKYGNTSSVSVPLTIISELKDKLNEKKEILLSAFGVGMTWASAILTFFNPYISDIIEVENGKPVDLELQSLYTPPIE